MAKVNPYLVRLINRLFNPDGPKVHDIADAPHAGVVADGMIIVSVDLASSKPEGRPIS